MVHNSDTQQRQQLLTSLARAGVRDKRVLAALTDTAREHFVEEAYRDVAYTNQALPIPLGQTISQPLMVGIMTQALRLSGRERVLEIGTGSGYQTAILARLAAHVYSVERHAQLAWQAAVHLMQEGRENVSLFVGDGTLGWPEQAPYDRILVTAAAPELPPSLLAQLKMYGLLVIPIGGHERQELQVIQRVPAGTHTFSLGGCVFVPLVGEEGWRE